MASGKDFEPKIEYPRWRSSTSRGAYLRILFSHGSEFVVKFYTDDRCQIDYYKENPPPYVDEGKWSDDKTRKRAANELSLEICEMLNHLHVLPSPTHVQVAFDNNQIATLRYVMRYMMNQYTTNNT